MRHPTYHSVLSSMIDLRRLPAFAQEPVASLAYKQAWSARHETPEARILEIAELVCILELDGFPIPEIFRRVGTVYSPPPRDLNQFSSSTDPLRAFLAEHLSAHAPTYTELGADLLNAALALAELWGRLNAEHKREASWPPAHMLSPPGPLAYIMFKAGEEREFDTRNGAIEIIDALLSHFEEATARDLRRMRARAIPGDELRNYSTGPDSFALMMGSAGVALVRSGRSVDYAELLMN